jgi:ribonuclease Z
MFTAFLIHEPFGDPGAYLEFKFRRHDAFLFDLGDLHPLTPKRIRKVSYILVSHTHMDHFIGFDHLLRLCLGRDRHIALFGPPGFLSHVESKLKAYTWNLVENYTNDFALAVSEIHESYRITRTYRCRNAFRPEDEGRHVISGTVLADTGAFRIHFARLDHAVPCLAYGIEEKIRVNIKRNVLQEMGLSTGAWINRFKEQIIRQEAPQTPVRIVSKNPDGAMEETFLPLGLLKEKVVAITAGQKVCYITDAVWSEANVEKMVELARGAELLFIEAPFLEEDMETAARKHHLTARQAGTIAALAQVKRFVVFHFSPKYAGRHDALQREAMEAYNHG